MRGPASATTAACASAFLALLTCAAVSLHAGPAAAAPQEGEAQDGGIRLHWRYAPVASDEGLGTLTLDIGDAAGQPTGHDTGQILAWLQRRRGALSDAETSCSDKVKSLLTQGLGQRADIDLTDYRLVTRNSDGSVAFINPFVGLNNAKLESIIDLHAVPRGWVQLPDRMEAWAVTEPDDPGARPARLVRIDLQARRVTADLALPEAPASNGLAYDPAARRLWLALPGAGRLGVVDVADGTPRPVWQDAAGLAGVVALGGQAGGGGTGVVALYRDGRAAWHDGAATAAKMVWETGGTPVAAGWSALARRIILATAEGDLLWLDPAAAPSGQPARRLALGHGVAHLALFDGGRRAMTLGPDGGDVIDIASGQGVTTLARAAGADGIVLSRNFAYATRSRDGRALLWSLADLRAGRDRPAEVITGSPAAEAAGGTGGDGAARVVADPDGEGILMASPADGMIFRYSEGMMAPSGSYSNYRRGALGLMVLDLSLRRTAPGRFRGTIRHEQSGAYDLIMAGIGPRFSACARVVLAPPAGQPSQVERTTRAVLLDSAAGSGMQSLRLRVDRTEGGRTAALPGLGDLTMLVFDKRSGWQRRIAAHEVAPGEYEARLPLPRSGPYDVLVSSPSADLSYGEGRLGALHLGAGP